MNTANTAKPDMSQHEYFVFVKEPAPTINKRQQVTTETRSRAHTELARCIREYLHLRLPILMHNYQAHKTINQRINVTSIYTFGEPIEKMANVKAIFISTYLHWFVRIPFRVIKDPSQCEPILNELYQSLLDAESVVHDLNNVVAQLQRLDDADEDIDVAPYLFQEVLTEADLQSLRRIPTAPKPAEEVLSEGFFQSSYYNLMADVIPSPADMLTQRLRSVSKWDEAQRRKFYANFACLVQGSGSGKSRVAKECGENFYEVYLCLRPESSSGIPPRSALAPLFLNLAAEVATTKDAHVGLIDCFFAAIFYVIANNVDWKDDRTDGRVLPSTFWDYTTVGQHANDFAKKVEQRFNHWRTYPTASRETVRDLMEKALCVLDPHGSNNNSRATFLVVLDEARQLLIPCPRVPDSPSLFLQWRFWLSNIDTWSYAFFLLLDTTSKVTNFVPSNAEDDPSSRIAERGIKLLHPIFEFPFLGPWPLPNELQMFLEHRHSSTVVPPSAWSTITIGYQPLIDLFVFSRPMYLYTRPSASLKASTSLDDLMGAVMALAQKKLFTLDPKCAQIPTVAVCYRYALRPYELVLQDTLLGSHSATLMGIFSDGLLDVQYLPEPIVGEALSRWRPLPSPSNRSITSGQDMTPEEAAQTKLNVLLDHLQAQLLSRQLIRSLSKGDRGELATSVYLLHAYEEATRNANMATRTEQISGATAAAATATAAATSTSMTTTSGVYQTYSGLLRVEDWISTLAGVPLAHLAGLINEGAAPGSTVASSVRLTRVLASGVSFTGWTVAQEPIIAPMLQYAWCHRVGFFSNDEEPAMDLVLPLVRCPSETMMHTEDASYAAAGAAPAFGQKKGATEAPPIVNKKRPLEEDVATEAPPVKRSSSSSVATSTSPTIAGGSSLSSTTNVVAAGETKEKEMAMAALLSAKQQGFLPDRCPGLSAVAIQVKNYANNIYLGDAYMYCRMQADRLCETAKVQDDVLSVLCMTGTGRVVSRYLKSPASEGVFLFVEDNTSPPGPGNGGSTFVGLVVNGFDGRLVGAKAMKKLESLSALLSSVGAARQRYKQECMDETLAEQYTLISRQQNARLPGDFNEAAYSKSAVDTARKSTAEAPQSSSSSSSFGRGKKPKAVAADQPLTWTHQLLTVTSERVERILHVYSLEPPMAG